MLPSKGQIQRALRFWPQDDLAELISNTIAVLDNDTGYSKTPRSLGRRWERSARLHSLRPFKCSRTGCDEHAVDQQPDEQPCVCEKHDPGR